MEQVLIFPYSGNGKEALECLSDQQEFIAFIHDDISLHGNDAHGNPIGGRELLLQYPQAKVVAVPGSAKSFTQRQSIIESLGILLERFTNLIHPSAVIARSARIGKNVFISAHCTIGPEAIIGDHVIMLANSLLHHDSIIDNYSIICGGVTIAGNTKIGVNVYVGAGSTITNGIEIGNQTLVGSGTNVISSVAEGLVVVGNPQKQVRHSEQSRP